MFKYVDPGTNDIYVFRYIVTQFEEEGPERLEFAKVEDIEEKRLGEFKIWPDDLPIPTEVAGHFFGELLDNDFDVPGFFETFSMIRAVRDDLKGLDRRRTRFYTFNKIKEAVETLTKYGDLDVNYGIVAHAALAGDLKARGQLVELLKD